MFPYKVQLVQALKSIDNQQRLDYTIYFRQKTEQNSGYIHNLIMNHEAHFQLYAEIGLRKIQKQFNRANIPT